MFPAQAGCIVGSGKSGTKLVLLLLALSLGGRIGPAQVATARLEGVVQDASGAVVPRGKVSVVNHRTGARADTSADSEGLFAFPSLPPSVYTLSVEAAGFRTAVVSKTSS